MGIVTAIELFDDNGTAPGDPDIARRRGVRYLGKRILVIIEDAISDPDDINRRNYAKAMKKAIRQTVRKKVPQDAAVNAGENRFEVNYEYVDGGVDQKKRILDVVRLRNQVLCSLEGQEEHSLVLNIKLDVRDADALEMDVLFPSKDDGADFKYLQTAADDIEALHGGGPGKNYIAAFKFLSRCK